MKLVIAAPLLLSASLIAFADQSWAQLPQVQPSIETLQVTPDQSTNAAPSGFMPPAVPPRPELPLIPATTGAMVTTLGKPALAWRVKAQELRSNRQATSQIVDGQFDEVMMMVAGSLAKLGYKVDTFNTKAGEILAIGTNSGSQQKLIFVFAEPALRSIVVKGAGLPASRPAAESIKNVLDSLAKPDPTRASF